MYLSIVKWLENHLLQCPFKMLFGMDCPGCGFQRACIALLKGNLVQSLNFYPAAIPVIITALVLLLDSRYKLNKYPKAKNMLYLFTATIIIISYLNKIFLH